MVPAVSAQAATPSGTPIGNVDSVTAVAGGVRVTGWAWDPDTSRSITVTVTAGGRSTTSTASGHRPDVPRVYDDAGSHHGFEAVLKTPPGTHKVCVTAENVRAGSDRKFDCTTVNVPESSPFGFFDRVEAVKGGVRVFGWAADLDTSGTIDVSIKADGKTSRVDADEQRPDVPRVWPGTRDDHGYDTVVDLPAGKHSVCVTGINTGSGSNTDFGCKTVTVAGAAAPATPVSKPVPVPAPAPEPEPEPAPAPAPKPAPAPAPEPAPAPAPKPAPAPAPSGGKPGDANTGVPSGTSLKRHDGDLVITQDGTVVDGLDVRGFVEVQAKNVTIRNSAVRGRSTTSYRALVTVNSPEHSVTVEDSDLIASEASPWVDGLRGMNITARRVEVKNVIDSVHVYGSNVLIESSWLHDNAYFAKDPNWGGTGSHNDNVQVQIGDNITIRNNTITGTENAAIMLTQDRGTVSNFSVTGNFLDDGACIINIKSRSDRSAPKNVTIADNTFGYNSIYRGCGIKMPNSGYKLNLKNNVFTDGKAVGITR